MKLKLAYRFSYGGNPLGVDEFAYSWFNKETGPTSIYFYCRGNSKRPRICSIPITQEPAANRKWDWDGNWEEPTISPSIGCDARCGWHGHIIKGDILP